MCVYLNLLSLIQFEFRCVHLTYRLTERLQSQVICSSCPLREKMYLFIYEPHFPRFDLSFFSIFSGFCRDKKQRIFKWFTSTMMTIMRYDCYTLIQSPQNKRQAFLCWPHLRLCLYTHHTEK